MSINAKTIEKTKQEKHSDKLYFFSRSIDVETGKGANEYVKSEEKYKKLSEIKDWRKILSNFYESEFIYDGKHWNTVEHAFQSEKIKLADPDQAFLFTLDSGSTLGKNYGSEARKNKKMVKLNQKTIK